jgi:hypothetical protein
MKKLELASLTAILLVCLLHIEAAAEFIPNPQDKIGRILGLILTLKLKKSIQMLNSSVWIVQDNTVWK